MIRYLKPTQQSNFPRYYPPYPVPYAEYDVDNVYGSVNSMLQAMDVEEVINGLIERSGSCASCGSHNIRHGSCASCGSHNIYGGSCGSHNIYGGSCGSHGSVNRKARRQARRTKRKDRRSDRRERRQDRRGKRRDRRSNRTNVLATNPVVKVSISEAQDIMDNQSSLLNNLPPRKIDSFDNQIQIEGMALAPIASGMAPVAIAAQDDEAANRMSLATKALIATAILGGGFLAFRTLDIGDLL